MKTIQTAYINALLADASYVTLSRNGVVITTQSEISANLTATLTQPQADYLLTHFDILTQTLSPTGGFDAVVWKGKAGGHFAGQVFVSTRGTESLQDGADNVDLTARGVAYNQIRDMANWWLRATAKAGEIVQQIRVDIVILPPTWVNGMVIPGTTRYTFAADNAVTATGELHGQVGKITGVNGHSLGGYLATMFTRLFGQSVDEVHTYNSAGLSQSSLANLEAEIGRLVQAMGIAKQGLSSFGAVGQKQTNHFAENGFNLTTNEWWFQQIGGRNGLNQEESLRSDANHSMYKLTDMLALGTRVRHQITIPPVFAHPVSIKSSTYS